MARVHRTVLTVVLLMAGAGCGDDSVGETSGSLTTSTSISTSTAADPTSTSAPAGEEPLTASFRGVTEDEILIGVGYVDASVFGFDQGDIEAQWQAAIDAVNESGGVRGRTIRPIFGGFSPVSDVEMDEVCVRFTEDEEVFAFVGVVRQQNEICYTADHETIAINTLEATGEAIAASNGLLFTTEPTSESLEVLAVERAAADGLIDGARVQISHDQDTAPLVEPVRAALEEAGAEVIGVAEAQETGEDILESQADQDLFLERALTDGADTIFGMGRGGIGAAGAVERAGAELTVISTMSLASAYTTFGYDPAAIDLRVYGPETWESLYDRGDAGVSACLENYEARSGATVNVGVVDPAPDNFVPVVRACRGIDLFVAIADAAGPVLTNESFVTAAAGLGEIELTGATAASMTAGKTGADDSPLVALEWDSDVQDFVVTS